MRFLANEGFIGLILQFCDANFIECVFSKNQNARKSCTRYTSDSHSDFAYHINTSGSSIKDIKEWELKKIQKILPKWWEGGIDERDNLLTSFMDEPFVKLRKIENLKTCSCPFVQYFGMIS